VIEGNFLDELIVPLEVWSRISVLYICSTCFSDADMMPLLFDRFTHLSQGAIVILLDKSLPQELLITPSTNTTIIKGSQDENEVEKRNTPSEIGHTRFQLMFSSQCLTSWGVARAFVYSSQGAT
jgi:hypothetical protein